MNVCSACGTPLAADGVCHDCRTIIRGVPSYVPVVTPLAARRSRVPWLIIWGCGLLAAAAVLFIVLARKTPEVASSATSPTVIPSTSVAVAPSTTVGPNDQVEPPIATTVPAVPTPSSAAPIVALPTVPPTTIPSTGWNGLYTDAPGSGMLRIGDKGQRVAELQTALGDAGLLSPPYDGDFGRGTEAALLEFQRSQGLVADGLAGSRTLAALGLGVGFEGYDDAIAATLRFLNSGDRTGLSQRMTYDLQNFAGLGTSLGAQWAAGGQVSSASTGANVFSFSLGGTGGVYQYIEVSFLAAPGHSWNGVVYAQGH